MRRATLPVPASVCVTVIASAFALALSFPLAALRLDAQEVEPFLPTHDTRFVLVKFRDDAAVRVVGRELLDARGRSIDLGSSAGELEVTAVFAPPASDKRLRAPAALERRLSAYFTVRTGTSDTARDVVARLQADERVESAHVPKLPPPSPSTGATADYDSLQGYLGTYFGIPPNPPPLRARPLWDYPGGTGKGVGFIDIEYGWNLAHEDLPSTIQVVGPTPLVPANLNAAWERHHGTASLGVVVGAHNGLGINGLAPDAAASVAGSFTDPTVPYEVNVARAVDRARNTLAPGDVILLEAQIGGPSWTNPQSQIGLVPVEWQQVVFDAIRAATQAGIIVVEAAGNGSQNLDDAVYLGRFDRTQRDSDALIVTSVPSGPPVPGGPAPTTNSGSRIDLKFWSSPIVTTGFGDLQDSTDDLRDYSQSTFTASSAASAIVAGGVVSVQGIARALLGAPLGVASLETLLQQTGSLDGATPGTVGVRPRFLDAVRSLLWSSVPVDPLLGFGATDNPSFELLAGACFCTVSDWLVTSGHALSLSAPTGFGPILPTHRARMLLVEDTTADGVPIAARAGVVVPASGGSLTVDLHFLVSALDAGDLADAARARLWIVDPSDGTRLPLADVDLTVPLAPSAHSAYAVGSGWHTARSRDLASFAGRILEVHVEVVARFGARGPKQAALLVDHFRFETANAPSITAIMPASGSECGGTLLTVSGNDFTAGDTVVTIGGVPLVNPLFVDTTTIVGETPPGSAGSAAVAVTSLAGAAAASSPYVYTADTCSAPAVRFLRGDANDDGSLDLSDSIFTLGFLFLGAAQPACLQACDANDDGSLDISDPSYLLNHLFLGALPPPAPHPGCGTDTTTDTLGCSGPTRCP